MSFMIQFDLHTEFLEGSGLLLGCCATVLFLLLSGLIDKVEPGSNERLVIAVSLEWLDEVRPAVRISYGEVLRLEGLLCFLM
jgi:hypothetical protein